VSHYFHHIRLLFSNPPKAWHNIKKDDGSYKRLFFGPVILVIAGMSLCLLVGESLSMASTGLFIDIIKHALIFFVANLLSFYIISVFINAIISSFTGKKDMARVGQLLLYTLSPYYFVMSVFYIFPSLIFILLVPVYCFVLLWFGVKQLIEIPSDKITGFYIVTALIVVGINLISHFVFNYAFLKVI